MLILLFSGSSEFTTIVSAARTYIVPVESRTVTVRARQNGWQRFTKDPDAELDYSVDWTRWLATLPTADAILTSTWTGDLDGVGQVVNEDEAVDGAVTSIWLSGGTLRNTYTLTNRISTVGGRVNDQTIKITVQPRSYADYNKDPDALLDFSVDWGTRWLDGDTIVSSEWIVPSGISDASTMNTASIATIWLSSGTGRESYPVVNRITTAAGRTNDQTLQIRVYDR